LYAYKTLKIDKGNGVWARYSDELILQEAMAELIRRGYLNKFGSSDKSSYYINETLDKNNIGVMYLPKEHKLVLTHKSNIPYLANIPS
jgi:hypothetical protein